MSVPYISSTKELSESASALIVIDFTATWCGPCKQISPIYERLANEYTGVKFLKVDIDNAPDFAQEYSISSVPTFIFLKDGNVVNKFSGANPRALKDGLDGLIKAASSDAP